MTRSRPQDSPETQTILQAAVGIHNWLGGGHPWAAYREALACEFALRAIPFWREPFRPGHAVDFLCSPGIVVDVQRDVDDGRERDVHEVLQETGLAFGLRLDFAGPCLEVHQICLRHGPNLVFQRPAPSAAS
ncbi:MAG: hypothetical protein V4510_01950 [bacterium]